MANEQDMLIAEKCLGWTKGRPYANGNGEWKTSSGEWFRDDWDGTPSFTTNLDHAMMLVDAWQGDFDIRRQNGHWKVTFFEPSYEHESTWKSKTLSEAICEAALKAWGAK